MRGELISQINIKKVTNKLNLGLLTRIRMTQKRMRVFRRGAVCQVSFLTSPTFLGADWVILVDSEASTLLVCHNLSEEMV